MKIIKYKFRVPGRRQPPAPPAGVEKKIKKKALLIWGASSSVGTGGVQSARLLREDPTSAIAAVYATAGAANNDYVRALGADVLQGYHFARPVPAAEVFAPAATTPVPA